MNANNLSTEKAAFNYWCLMLMAAACLISSILTGLFAGIVTAWPDPISTWVSLRALRPAHTFLALGWLFCGIPAAVGLYCARHGRVRLGVSRAQIGLFAVFLIGVVVATFDGKYSGREYATWPVQFTVPLVLALGLTVFTVTDNWAVLARHSPEAAWLLLVGSVLLPAGLIEENLYLVLGLAADPGRDLMVQWHALDTVIAAWCILLYGIGILLVPAGIKPLRAGWLFALAVVGILLDFGHHNFVSPQPHIVKLVSFSATMLAVVSFGRHIVAFRRSRPSGVTLPGMMRHVELWTLFAVGTGIVLAVPWLNLYAHGTYVIVSHTMGSMIGVNSLLLFVAAFHFAGVETRGRVPVVRAASVSLLFFCLTLAGLGLVRGVLRIDHDELVWYYWVRPLYLLIPVSAIPLTACLSWLAVDLVRCSVRAMKSLEADDIYGTERQFAAPEAAATSKL